MRSWFLGLAAALVVFGCGDSVQQVAPVTEFVVAARVPSDSTFGAASAGQDFLVAYTALGPRAENDVVGVRVSRAGELLDASPFPISAAPRDSLLDSGRASYGNPAVAAGESGYGVVYLGRDPGTTAREVAFVPVSFGGRTTAPPTPLRFSFVSAPVGIARRDAGFTAVYSREQRLMSPRPGLIQDVTFVSPEAAFLDQEGDRVEAQPVDGLAPEVGVTDDGVSTTQAPSVASSPTDTLVAWFQFFSSGEHDLELRGAWIAPQEPSETVTLATASTTVAATRAASSGSDFLVVWTATAQDTPSRNEIRGVRVRRQSGAVGSDFVAASGPEVKALGGVAFARDHYLVVWSEDGVVVATHVDRDGSVGAPFVVDAGPAAPETAVASDGTRFLVLFARPTSDGASSLHGVLVD